MEFQQKQLQIDTHFTAFTDIVLDDEPPDQALDDMLKHFSYEHKSFVFDFSSNFSHLFTKSLFVYILVMDSAITE